MTAQDELLAALRRAGYSQTKAEDLVEDVKREARVQAAEEREKLAEVVRTYMPKDFNPGDEEAAAVHTALGLAANAVERGYR